MTKPLPRALWIALLSLALALVSCNRQEVDALGVKVNLTKKTLSNGLTLITVEDHTVPVVSYQTWYRVGSVDEQPGVTGISHLFEHLMFKGTPKYGPKEFFLQLEAKGAEVNAFTTRDYTVFYENLVPTMLEKAIDMESDRMVNLKLDDDVLNSERLVVLEERRLRSENVPEGKIQEALWALAYHTHPYMWPVIGYPQDLLSITTAKLQEWFHNHYSPSNATLVVVGDIDPSKTDALVKQYYGSIPAVPVPKRKVEAEPEQNEERRFVIRDKVASERLAQAYHVTSAEQDDSYSLDVLANILFEGTSSRAYRKLVEEKDLMTGISGSAYTPTYPGLFIIIGYDARRDPRADRGARAPERHRGGAGQRRDGRGGSRGREAAHGSARRQRADALRPGPAHRDGADDLRRSAALLRGSRQVHEGHRGGRQASRREVSHPEQPLRRHHGARALGDADGVAYA